MDRVEAIAKLDQLSGEDQEGDHLDADQILIAFLKENGAADVAEAWERARNYVGFWYA